MILKWELWMKWFYRKAYTSCFAATWMFKRCQTVTSLGELPFAATHGSSKTQEPWKRDSGKIWIFVFNSKSPTYCSASQIYLRSTRKLYFRMYYRIVFKGNIYSELNIHQSLRLRTLHPLSYLSLMMIRDGFHHLHSTG